MNIKYLNNNLKIYKHVSIRTTICNLYLVCGEAECVRLVLAAGARPSTPDLRGGSPLHYAAQCCGAAATAELAVPKKVGIKVLQTLLEFGADVNAKDEDGRQPILWAASAGSVEAVLALAR